MIEQYKHFIYDIVFQKNLHFIHPEKLNITYRPYAGTTEDGDSAIVLELKAEVPYPPTCYITSITLPKRPLIHDDMFCYYLRDALVKLNTQMHVDWEAAWDQFKDEHDNKRI